MMANAIPAPVLDTRNEDQLTAQAIGALPAELSDRSNANPAVVLLESAGAVTGQLLYQINRWPAAVVQKLLALINALQRSAQAATVTQRFTLSAPQGIDTVIPAATQVGTQDGSLTFATLADLLIPAYSTPAGTVTATAGSTTVTGVGTSFPTDGTWSGWQIQIPASTGPWYGISSVQTSTSLTLSTSASASVSSGVAFSVGAVSGVVQAQATITGSTTNVGAGKLISASSAPAGVSATTNPAAASGGSDDETPAAAVARAPEIFASRDVAVSVNDYARFAARILGPGGRATAVGNFKGSTAAQGAVSLGLLSPAWTVGAPVSTVESAAVMRDLQGRRFVGSNLYDYAAAILAVSPTALFYRQATCSDNQAKANAAKAINTLYSPNTYPWGRVGFVGDLIKVIETAPGIDRVQVINGVPCVTAGPTTTTAHVALLTNNSSTVTGTSSDFTSMFPGRTILVDGANNAAYLVTSVSGGSIGITPPYAGPTANTTLLWFNAGDYSAGWDWRTLPYSSLSTSVDQPDFGLTVVGAA